VHPLSSPEVRAAGAQFSRPAVGRILWDLTREIVHLQPEGETGFASVLGESPSLLRGQTMERLPPAEQELEQARCLKATADKSKGCRRY